MLLEVALEVAAVPIGIFLLLVIAWKMDCWRRRARLENCLIALEKVMMVMDTNMKESPGIKRAVPLTEEMMAKSKSEAVAAAAAAAREQKGV